jgi:hypothetical protein
MICLVKVNHKVNVLFLLSGSAPLNGSVPLEEWLLEFLLECKILNK